MLAAEVELVLVWCWFGDIIWVNMGGVLGGVMNVGRKIVRVGFHYALGLSEFGTERRVRERCIRAKAKEGKFGDGHRGWLCGLVTGLIVRITTTEDQVTYSREQQVREACGLSSRENRTWASICEALSSELSSLASAFDAQPPIVAACSPDYQVVEFVLSQRSLAPKRVAERP